MPDDQPHEAFGLPGGRRLRWWIIGLLAASIVAGIVFDLAFGQFISLRPSSIQAWLQGRGQWGPVIYIGAMIVAVVISPIPSVPLDIAAGLAFGLVAGTVYTLVGAEIGAIIAFLIARRLGRPWLARRLPVAMMRHIDALVDRQGVRTIIIMRLLPIFSFDLVSYAAGLTTMSLPRFAMATLLGMTLPVIAITSVGSSLTDQPLVAGSIFAVLLVLTFGPAAVWFRRHVRLGRAVGP